VSLEALVHRRVGRPNALMGKTPAGELEENAMADERECLRQEGQAGCTSTDVTLKQMESC
jgi:hypothetical protein